MSGAKIFLLITVLCADMALFVDINPWQRLSPAIAALIALYLCIYWFRKL